MADLTEEYLRNIQILVDQIASDVDRFAMTATGQIVEVAGKTRKEVQRVKDDTKKALNETEQYFERINKQNIIRISLFGEKADKVMDTWRRKNKEAFDELTRHLTQARGQIGTLGDAMGVSGSGGLFGGIMSVQKSLVQATIGTTPFGGLIGLMLFGMMKPAEWAATGQRIARQFAAVGDVSGASIRKATADFKRYQEKWLGTEQDLAAVDAGFAQFGVSSETALTAAGISADGFGGKVQDISFALDNMFKAGSGTFAKTIGEVMQSSGKDIASTTQEVTRLAVELRNLGGNVPQLVAQFTQMQSGMRMQRQGVDDLRKSFFMLRGGLGSGVLAGSSDSHLTEMASRGMKGAQGAMGGMNEGLMAVLGEQISGGKVSGVDSIMAMKQGLLGKGGSAFGQMAMGLGSFAQQNIGGSQNDQIFGLSKIMGTDIESARAIVLINEQMQKDINAGTDETEAMTEATKQLNKVMAQRAAETSPWEKLMITATNTIADIAASLLSVIISGFMQLGNLPIILKGAFGEIGEGEQAEYQIALEQNKLLSEATAGFVDSLFSAEKKGEKSLGALVPPGVRTLLNKTRAIREKHITNVDFTPEPEANALEIHGKGVGGFDQKTVEGFGRNIKGYASARPEVKQALGEAYNEAYEETKEKYRDTGRSNSDIDTRAKLAAGSAMNEVNIGGRPVLIRDGAEYVVRGDLRIVEVGAPANDIASPE